MKRILVRLMTIICLLAAVSLNSVAQEKKPRPDEVKVPTDGAFKVLGPKFALTKVVKGAPYSATAVTERVQTLSDGNQIIRKNESKLYRDSEGRTRIEQTLETIGKWTADGDVHQRIFVNDPVAGASYSFNPRARIVDKIIIVPEKRATGGRVEIHMVNGQRIATYTINGETVTQAEFESTVEKKRSAQGETHAKPGRGVPNDPEWEMQLKMLQPANLDIDPGQKKSESLGTQTIEGVTAEGARVTLTIPAGEIGNTLPIEVVDETWFSPELQITVMTKHRDPRFGETTYRLTSLNRSEPDRSLFESPVDYTLVEGKINIKLPVKKRATKEER